MTNYLVTKFMLNFFLALLKQNYNVLIEYMNYMKTYACITHA